MNSKNKLPSKFHNAIRGVVLREVKSMREDIVSKRLQKLRRIIDRGKDGRIEGVVVDPITAQNILDYYNQLSDENASRFLNWPIRRMMFGANNAAMNSINR